MSYEIKLIEFCIGRKDDPKGEQSIQNDIKIKGSFPRFP
jgi:hypothetical protein